MNECILEGKMKMTQILFSMLKEHLHIYTHIFLTGSIVQMKTLNKKHTAKYTKILVLSLAACKLNQKGHHF